MIKLKDPVRVHIFVVSLVPKIKQLPMLDFHHMSKSSSSRKPLREQSKLSAGIRSWAVLADFMLCL